MTLAVHPQLWWYLARSSGLVAWGLSVCAVLAGLALATRALGPQPRPAWLLDLHRFLGGLTVAFVVLHLAAIVADGYVHFSLVDLVVPYAAGWRPGAVALGIVAMYLLVAVEASSLAMRRLPRRAWRRIHLGSYVMAATATLHGYAAGADARHPVFVWAGIAAAASVGFFVAYRVVLPDRRGRLAARRPATPTGPNSG